MQGVGLSESAAPSFPLPFPQLNDTSHRAQRWWPALAVANAYHREVGPLSAVLTLTALQTPAPPSDRVRGAEGSVAAAAAAGGRRQGANRIECCTLRIGRRFR